VPLAITPIAITTEAEAVKQERASRQYSVRQSPNAIHPQPVNGPNAIAGGRMSVFAAQSLVDARPSRLGRFRPSRGRLIGVGANGAQVPFPATTEKWQGFGSGLIGIFRERLGAQETRRRLLHATTGLLPFVLWVVPHDPPSSVRFLSIIGGLIVTLAAVAYYQFGRVLRTAERGRDVMGAVFGYATVVLVTMLLCPRHVELAFAALAVLAFGDGSATLGGLLMRGRRLPWNPRKSIFGTLCFVLVATPLAALIYWGQAHDAYETAAVPHVGFRMALLGALAAAGAAALVESLPVKSNDNLRVGTTAAVVLVMFQYLVVGWA
jgi:dolichol kinase